VLTLRHACITAALLALSIWAAFHWYQSIALVHRYYDPLPYEDYWRVAQNWSQYKNFQVGVLWQQHNEHRIVFPELVFASDMLLAKGRELVPLICSVLCYFGVLLTFGFVLFRETQWPVSLRLAAVLLAAIVMGWKGSAFVLAQPFLLQWTLTQAGVVLSLAFLTAVRSRGSRLLAASITAAVVATYSSGNGMLLWPILIGAGLLLKLRTKEMTALTLSAVLAVGLYFVGYHASSRLNFGNFFRHPLYSLEFLGAYVSMPFGGMKAPRFGAYLGIACIAVMLLLCVICYRKSIISKPPAVVLFGCYAFAVLTALLTAAGRMDATDPHYASAEAVRYLTLPLMSWAAFLSASVWVSARLRMTAAAAWAVTAVFSLLLLLGLPKLRWWLRGNQRPFAQRQFTSLAVENGITDNNLLAMIFPDPLFVRSRLPELRAAHLSIFSDENSNPMGKSLESFGPVIGNSPAGRITYVFPIENGLEIAGFSEMSGAKRILLASEKGRVLGFAKSLPAGFPSFIPLPSTSAAANWIGFANLTYASQSVSAYAVMRTGLLALGNAVPVPEQRPMSAAAIGDPIRSISWRTEPSASSNRIPAMPLSNPSGTIYSTWRNGDAEQATIQSSSFNVPSNHCLILPVLVGPSTEALSIGVLDSATGQNVARVPLQNESAGWVYWRIPIAHDVRSVRILAVDHGSGWGQWLAVADPRECH
jgi:hypothetical protein